MDRTATRRWLIVPLVLILLSFVLPYTLLSDVDAWYGSFLFWTLATAVVIGVNAIISSRWED
ncbi:hypothetical protein [Janibacter limosus]|uniref:hypothetical protein n=1 Tax=Janibacter limosus TaxID=53458 RepID=UPI000832B702|nr:hypothetical protein [Janibacter limosus]